MANGPATYLQAGGEVYNTWPNVCPHSVVHTTTAMASAYPGSDGYKYAAYQRDVMYIDSSAAYHSAALQYINTPSYENDDSILGLCGLDAAYLTDCSGGYIGGYDITTSPAAGGTGWDTYFYFGGGVE